MNRRERDRSTMQFLLAGLVVLVAGATFYLAGYLFLGSDRVTPPGPGTRVRMRVFPHEPVAVVYRPAGWVESQIRGYRVAVGTRRDLIHFPIRQFKQ